MRLLAVTGLALLCAACAAPPDLSSLTYLGGSGTDDCDGVTLDSAGDIYLACHSDSPDFPGAPGRSPVSMDAVILKIDGRTGKLAWAARTGGSDWDGAGELIVASDGSIYVLGSTRSADFPTTPDAVQRRFGGPDRDGFLLKLDPTGKIVYATLLGGSKNDEARGLALAPDGTVYIGGVTMSPDFPGPRAPRLGPGGEPEAFVARLRPGDPASLQTLLIGGKGREQISSLALNSAGNLFAAGHTTSPDFPLKDAIQPRFGGGVDGFLLKLRASDWRLEFATYFGGSKNDGADVTLDAAGNPILYGVTDSDDLPTTKSAFQPQRRGPVDAFVANLTADGSRILWSTYYGGSKSNSDQFLSGTAAVDDAGRVWFTGMTASPDLPLHNALQSQYGGGDFDGFVAALSSDGSKLCYGSYVGGSAHDILEGLALTKEKLIASGLTSSRNLAQRGFHLQPHYGGGPYDAFIVTLTPQLDQTCR
jgi:hypothetical protein